jgi:hypothetical protein
MWHDEVRAREGTDMAQATTKPNFPVFVSSTFTDMQVYRRKIRDALTQLEAVVRGMEQFGSKPGSPVDECLKVVQSCRLYVGVFGMRYDTVPEGHTKSMTHIEYDEAQRLTLPSLIYILNEDHPIPAKDVETGTGAEKLQTLKELLKKRHTVSFFTTPEDLQARLMHDVPTQLSQMGVRIEADALQKAEETSDREVLQNFQMLPKLYAGRKVTVEFILTNIRSAFDEDCSALRLEYGATVTAPARIDASTLAQCAWRTGHCPCACCYGTGIKGNGCRQYGVRNLHPDHLERRWRAHSRNSRREGPRNHSNIE